VQVKFIDAFGLTFPKIPDTTKKIIYAYGARGVLSVAAKRMTFLIDQDGLIAHVWPDVTLEGHAADVVRVLKEAKARL